MTKRQKDKKISNITYPLVVLIEGVIMANGELIHYGRSLGFVNEKQLELLETGANKTARGHEPIIALGDNTA